MHGRKRPNSDENDAIDVLAGMMKASGNKKAMITAVGQADSENANQSLDVPKMPETNTPIVSLRSPGLSLFQRFNSPVEVASCARLDGGKLKPGKTE